MKRALLLAFLPFLLGADKPWPQKGDVIYVSADLVSVTTEVARRAVVYPFAESPLAACIPVTVRKLGDELVAVQDPAGNGEWLRGPWAPRLHRSESECRAYLQAHGQPRIVRSNWNHVIVP